MAVKTSKMMPRSHPDTDSGQLAEYSSTLVLFGLSDPDLALESYPLTSTFCDCLCLAAPSQVTAVFQAFELSLRVIVHQL